MFVFSDGVCGLLLFVWILMFGYVDYLLFWVVYLVWVLDFYVLIVICYLFASGFACGYGF